MEQIAIRKHKILGYAGFQEEYSFEFSKDQPTLIYGVNGSGKTSLLNSLYSSIISYGLSVIAHDNFAKYLTSKTFINIYVDSAIIESIFFSIDNSTIKITTKIIDQYNVHREMEKKSINGGKSSHQGGFSLIQFTNQSIVPIFRYFKSEKLIQKNKTIVTNKSYNGLENRKVGYNNHCSENLSIQEVTSFIIDQINIENQAKVDNKDFSYTTRISQYIRETLNLFTTILYDTKVEVSVGASKYSSGQSLQIKKEEDILEFVQLSSGEQYVFGLVLELVYRNTILNPKSKDYRNTTGIVLIDEIEDHLHPRWQLTIIKALQVCFPKVQFIISSHSPLIASSVHREQIIALNNFEVIPSSELPDIYSGTADELLKSILFSGIQIADFDKEKQEISKLLRQFKFDDAQQKLEELKENVQSNPKWIRDFERRISFGKL